MHNLVDFNPTHFECYTSNVANLDEFSEVMIAASEPLVISSFPFRSLALRLDLIFSFLFVDFSGIYSPGSSGG